MGSPTRVGLEIYCDKVVVDKDKGFAWGGKGGGGAGGWRRL